MDKNISTVQKVFNMIETGNIDELNNLVDQGFIDNTPDPAFTSNKKGHEYVKDIIQMYGNTFSNLRVEIKQIFSCENKVVVYSIFKGKHTGKIKDIPASNKDISFKNMDIFKLENEKVTEHWGVADNLSLMIQMDVISEKELYMQH
ncbi:MAG: ester cyclase [Bacteroidota bacterium]|nr:ester cyclase [Bacteroidota bacterium]